MAEKQVNTNQTQFSFEEPIFENESVYQEEKPVDFVEKPKSKKKFFIIAGLGGFLLIVLALLVVLKMRNPRVEETIDTDTTAPIVKELGPLQQRIEAARELLDAADPAKQDLVFPPITIDLRLDPKTR